MPHTLLPPLLRRLRYFVFASRCCRRRDDVRYAATADAAAIIFARCQLVTLSPPPPPDALTQHYDVCRRLIPLFYAAEPLCRFFSFVTPAADIQASLPLPATPPPFSEIAVPRRRERRAATPAAAMPPAEPPR